MTMLVRAALLSVLADEMNLLKESRSVRLRVTPQPLPYGQAPAPPLVPGASGGGCEGGFLPYLG
jgi:hypothetical protein